MLKKLFILLAFMLIPAGFAAAGDSQYNTDNYRINEGEYLQEESPEFVYPNTDSNYPDTDSEPRTYSGAKTSKDYVRIYNELKPADFSYMHGLDPEEFYDIKDTTWAPYPLLRLNSYIYFKDIAIEPGYYLITPREHKGNWYVLFKQNGKVVHIIPVYDKGLVPETFYETHIPKPKLTPSQKVHMGLLSFLGKFNSTKRRDPVKSYMEINDLENYFVSIVIYYGPKKYSTIFRTIRL